jgi:hypothetical protein
LGKTTTKAIDNNDENEEDREILQQRQQTTRMADLGAQLAQLSPEQRQAIMMQAQQEANQGVMQEMMKHMVSSCFDACTGTSVRLLYCGPIVFPFGSLHSMAVGQVMRWLFRVCLLGGAGYFASTPLNVLSTDRILTDVFNFFSILCTYKLSLLFFMFFPPLFLGMLMVVMVIDIPLQSNRETSSTVANRLVWVRVKIGTWKLGPRCRRLWRIGREPADTDSTRLLASTTSCIEEDMFRS